MFVFVAGYTKHFVLCSLCYGSVIGMRAFLRRSPYAEVEPFGSVPSEKINGSDTVCVRAIYTHGGIRTHDPLLRRQLLYPTELRVLLDRAANVLVKLAILAQIPHFSVVLANLLYRFLYTAFYNHFVLVSCSSKAR